MEDRYELRLQLNFGSSLSLRYSDSTIQNIRLYSAIAKRQVLREVLASNKCFFIKYVKQNTSTRGGMRVGIQSSYKSNEYPQIYESYYEQDPAIHTAAGWQQNTYLL